MEREWLYAKVYALQNQNIQAVTEYVNKIKQHAMEKVRDATEKIDKMMAPLKRTGCHPARTYPTMLFFSGRSTPPPWVLGCPRTAFLIFVQTDDPGWVGGSGAKGPRKFFDTFLWEHMLLLLWLNLMSS